MNFLYLTLIIAPFFSTAIGTAYRGPVDPENKDNAPTSFVSSVPVATDKYVVDKVESVVKWKCAMVFAEKGGHYGYVSLSKGELMIEKGQLVGGKVEVDMNTIADELHNSHNNLIDHLKEPDFFDVKKFPISTFAITKVTLADADTMNVTGQLTIKGITHEITFPAKVEVKRKVINASGKVIVDRTQWDVRYRSGKFFDDLADRAISDDIEFEMKIVAKK